MNNTAFRSFILICVLFLAACASKTPAPVMEEAAEPTSAPITDSAAEASYAETGSVEQDNSVYEQIESDIAAYRLTSPAGNNAIEKIEMLRSANPNDPAISRFEQKILNQYLSLIDRTLVRDGRPTKEDLNKALRYIASARSISTDSQMLDDKEKQILDLLEIYSQQAALQKAMQAEQKAKSAEAATAAPNDNTQTSVSTATTTPPANVDYLAFKQQDVDNRAQEVGALIDQISPLIVKHRSPVIIHAQSMRDFRWINASLRTSIYFVDANYNLEAEPHVGPSVIPGIEISQ